MMGTPGDATIASQPFAGVKNHLEYSAPALFRIIHPIMDDPGPGADKSVMEAVYAIALVNWAAFANADRHVPERLEDADILETIDKVRRVWTSRRERAITVKIGKEQKYLWPILLACLTRLIPSLSTDSRLTDNRAANAALRDQRIRLVLSTIATLLMVVLPPRGRAHRRA